MVQVGYQRFKQDGVLVEVGVSDEIDEDLYAALDDSWQGSIDSYRDNNTLYVSAPRYPSELNSWGRVAFGHVLNGFGPSRIGKKLFSQPRLLELPEAGTALNYEQEGKTETLEMPEFDFQLGDLEEGGLNFRQFLQENYKKCERCSEKQGEKEQALATLMFEPDFERENNSKRKLVYRKVRELCPSHADEEQERVEEAEKEYELFRWNSPNDMLRREEGSVIGP